MSLQERVKEIIHRWKFTCTIPNEDFDEVINIVREYYGYKDSDITMIGSAHESDIRADERKRCIQIAIKAQIKHQSINGVFSDSGSSIIRAIKAE